MKGWKTGYRACLPLDSGEPVQLAIYNVLWRARDKIVDMAFPISRYALAFHT